MNILDSAKEKMRGLTDQANDLSGPAGEKLNSAKTAVTQGFNDANKFVDEKTGGKYSSTIHTGVDKAKGLFGKPGEQQADAQTEKPAQAPDAAEDSDESSSSESGPEQPSS